MSQLEKKMSAPDFWNNQEAARKTVSELKTQKAVVAPWLDISSRIEDMEVHFNLATEAQSEEDFGEISEAAQGVLRDLENLELKTLLSGEYDSGNCYFSIHAGAGGTESCDWAAS